MSHGFGNELPRVHGNTSPRSHTRYLVVIDSGGFMVARLFLESREQVAEFDASTEEVAQMITHLRADKNAGDRNGTAPWPATAPPNGRRRGSMSWRSDDVGARRGVRSRAGASRAIDSRSLASRVHHSGQSPGSEAQCDRL